VWWFVCLIAGHKPAEWVSVYPASKRRKLKSRRKRFLRCDRCGRKVDIGEFAGWAQQGAT
jgi:hypothetical protein